MFERRQLIALSFLLFTTVAAQAQTNKVDPVCERFQSKTLEELLANPPGVSIANQLLECLPRKVIRQFTEKEGPHVAITIACIEDRNGPTCSSNGKGYAIVAEALADIFRGLSRCLNCQQNHPTVAYAINLLQRRHPRLLQRGIQFLTLQD